MPVLYANQSQQLLDFALTSRLYLTKNPITAVSQISH